MNEAKLMYEKELHMLLADELEENIFGHCEYLPFNPEISFLKGVTCSVKSSSVLHFGVPFSQSLSVVR
jgi:hypothetical protein